MGKFIKLKYLLLSMSLLGSSTLVQASNIEEDSSGFLTLENVVEAAQKNDPWLVGNRHTQDAIESMSIAEGTLSDPKMSLALANIATDSFDFNQEAMTQFQLGVSQMFPRGDSLELKKKQLILVGSQFPYQREDRRAKVAIGVSNLWLEAYKAQESIALIEKDRALFEQLADIAQASYSSAFGKTRQQDIVRAQLELTRLDDRLTQLKQKKEMTQQQLLEWLNVGDSVQSLGHSTILSNISLSRDLPNIDMLQESLFTSELVADPNLLFKYFSTHPVVNALDQKIKASETGVELAKQKYKPEWGVSANYGFRDNAPNGMDRSDLFSIGVSFDLPLFTSNRQDKQVQSAVSEAAAVKTEKWLLVRQLIASFESSRSQLVRLNERKKLYQDRLLPQMHDQAEASLTAYTNDDGDFAEVVRARIAELNAAIDALDINVERQKSIIQLNYFFMKSANDIILNNRQSNHKFGENK